MHLFSPNDSDATKRSEKISCGRSNMLSIQCMLFTYACLMPSLSHLICFFFKSKTEFLILFEWCVCVRSLLWSGMSLLLWVFGNNHVLDTDFIQINSLSFLHLITLVFLASTACCVELFVVFCMIGSPGNLRWRESTACLSVTQNYMLLMCFTWLMKSIWMGNRLKKKTKDLKLEGWHGCRRPFHYFQSSSLGPDFFIIFNRSYWLGLVRTKLYMFSAWFVALILLLLLSLLLFQSSFCSFHYRLNCEHALGFLHEFVSCQHFIPLFFSKSSLLELCKSKGVTLE